MSFLPTSWRLARSRLFALAVGTVVLALGCQSSETNSGLAPAESLPTSDSVPSGTTVSPSLPTDSPQDSVLGAPSAGENAAGDPYYLAIDVVPRTVTVAPGGTVSFKALNWKAGVSIPFPFPLKWSATGGTVTSTGLYTAGKTTGNFHVVAQGTTTQYWADAQITIANGTATVTSIVLSPASVTLAPAARQQFSVSATLSNGSTQSNPAATYSATGGTISTSGLYTAGSAAGSFRVIASVSGKADTSSVTISGSTPTITKVTLTPASVSLASGATAQFTASATLSNGTTQSNPSLSWSATGGTMSSSALYTAGSTAGSFRVIASANGHADTSAVTITSSAPGNPGNPGNGRAIFHSDWSSSTGSGDAAVRDANKSLPWQAHWQGSRVLLTVVPASGKGFPSGMTNIMRVMHWKQDFDWVMINNAWQTPAVGSSLYFRAYFRNEISNATDAGTGYASTHPLESTGSQGGLGGLYYSMKYGSFSDGTFPWLFDMGGPAYPFNAWSPGAPSSTHGGRSYDPGTLQKNTTYRFEWKLTRRAANAYDLDIRIYGQDNRLLFDRNNIYAWTGSRSQTLAANGINLTIGDDRVRQLRIGLNGGFATTNPEYVYWGGVAVCQDDWCGEYGQF